VKLLFTLAAVLVPAFADSDAQISCPRARSDFALTADPNSKDWKNVPAIRAAVDPFGKPAGTNAFDFRVQWTPQNLYFLFSCPYDELNLKSSPSTTEETNKLWDWDVTEVFIAWDESNITQYKELQVSPQGEWVDLDIDRKNPKPEGWKWDAGMTVKARINKEKRMWYGEMKIPIKAIDQRPIQAGNAYRINIYRLAGRAPARQSIMWTPVHVRSHHTPDKFGRMVLAR